MVAIPELWSAILVSAVPVWIASAVIWMVLPHKSDFMTVLLDGCCNAATSQRR